METHTPNPVWHFLHWIALWITTFLALNAPIKVSPTSPHPGLGGDIGGNLTTMQPMTWHQEAKVRVKCHLREKKERANVISQLASYPGPLVRPYEPNCPPTCARGHVCHRDWPSMSASIYYVWRPQPWHHQCPARDQNLPGNSLHIIFARRPCSSYTYSVYRC